MCHLQPFIFKGPCDSLTRTFTKPFCNDPAIEGFQREEDLAMFFFHLSSTKISPKIRNQWIDKIPAWTIMPKLTWWLGSTCSKKVPTCNVNHIIQIKTIQGPRYHFFSEGSLRTLYLPRSDEGLEVLVGFIQVSLKRFVSIQSKKATFDQRHPATVEGLVPGIGAREIESSEV